MKQKLMAILLVLCMVVALVPAIALTSAAANTSAGAVTDGTLPDGATIESGTSGSLAGSGTEDDPYKIANVKDWRYFATTAAGTATAKTYFKLTGNIYMNQYLGDWDAKNLPTEYDDNSSNTLNGVKPTRYENDSCKVTKTFAGNLDGGNFAIYNPFNRASNGAGIFSTVTGTIENLNVYGGYLVGTGSANFSTLVTTLDGGTVSNCFVSTDAYLKGGNYGFRFGGIVAFATGSNPLIEGCTYTGTVVVDGGSDGMAGGIVGRAEGNALTIRDTVYNGALTAGVARVGGLVGMVNSGKTILEKCINYADITGNGSTAHGIGGMIGKNNGGTISLTQCANYGNINGQGYVAAGIVGHQMLAGGIIDQCANYGKVTGSGASGILQYIFGNQITNCYTSGTRNNTNSGESAGIVAGWVKNTTTIANCVGVGDGNLIAGSVDGVLTASNNKKYASDSLNIEEAVETLNTGLEPHVWVAGKTAPELKWINDLNKSTSPAIPIDGASLTISGNVTMNLYVKATSLSGMTFDAIYVTDGVNSYQGTLNGENYTFPITRLTAKEFGVNKEYAVQLVTGEKTETSTETVTYSPLQYAINMYGTLPEMTTLDPLLLSIVAYADAATGTTAAQTAFTAKHENADFATLPAYATILEGDAAKDTYTYNNAEKMPGFAAKLTETVTLHLDLTGADYTAVTATINGEKLNVVKNGNEVTISGLYATDLYNTITFTFTNGEGAETTATYSLMQYLNSYASDATYGALAQATAVYLYAARNFCLANRT